MIDALSLPLGMRNQSNTGTAALPASCCSAVIAEASRPAEYRPDPRTLSVSIRTQKSDAIVRVLTHVRETAQKTRASRADLSDAFVISEAGLSDATASVSLLAKTAPRCLHARC